VVGLGLQVQDIFHVRYKLGADLWEAPLGLQAGLEVVFLSTRRTDSSEYASANSRVTTRSAKSWRVQRSRPSGAGPQASAISRASALPSSLGVLPGRGRSLSAARPASTNRWRVRSTGAIPTPSARVMSPSVWRAAALSSMRARVNLRADACPRRMRCSRSSRSAGLKVTWYFFFAIAPAPPPPLVFFSVFVAKHTPQNHCGGLVVSQRKGEG